MGWTKPLRPKKKNCLFRVTAPKSLGRVGREIIFFFVCGNARRYISFVATVCVRLVQIFMPSGWKMRTNYA